MLVLKRRSNEMIMIGDDISVTVLEIRNDHVCICVQAPDDMPVRTEYEYEKAARERDGVVPKQDIPKNIDELIREELIRRENLIRDDLIGRILTGVFLGIALSAMGGTILWGFI